MSAPDGRHQCRSMVGAGGRGRNGHRRSRVFAPYGGLLRAGDEPPGCQWLLGQASLIVKTGRTWFTPESNAKYIGMHWLLTGKTSTSAVIRGSGCAGGNRLRAIRWQASVMVNPVLAVLTLIGVYLIGSRLTSPIWGLVTCVLLAVNTAFAVHALTAISHMPVACCLVWGIYLLLRGRIAGELRGYFWRGDLGCIPTIRYADSVVALGIGIFLLMHIRKFPNIWRHYLATVVRARFRSFRCSCVISCCLARFWRTGYTLTNEESGFGWNYFTQHPPGFLQLLQGSGLG